MLMERLLVICTSAFIGFKYLNHEKHAGYLLFHAALFVAASLKSIKWQNALTSLKFRPISESGVELGCFLVPMVISAQLRFDPRNSKIRPELWRSYLLSCQLMSMTTVCLILLANKFNSLGTFMAFSMVTSCLGITLNAAWDNDLLWYVYLLLAYLQILYLLLKLLPQSFALGEAMIISQTLVFVFTDAILTTHYKLQFIVPQHFNGSVDPSRFFMRSDITSLLQTFVIGSSFIGLMLCPVYYYLKLIGDGLELLFGYVIFYCAIGLSAMAVLIPMLYISLGGANPVLWVTHFITSKTVRMKLFMYWTLLVLIAVFIVVWFYFKSSSRRMILVRKYFHLLAVCIFVPGIMYDPSLTHLAASGATMVFMLLEYIRVGGIAPFGNFLHSCLSSFVDSRDSGKLILTHVYLLVGCAAPLWLYVDSFHMVTKVSTGQQLSLYSGVLSLGIGDTMASVVGINFGKHHWPGTSKTVEGTLGAAVSQLLGILILVQLGVINASTMLWIPVVISIVLTSLLEAWTSQIDNIVLPLFLYSLLNIICR